MALASGFVGNTAESYHS